MLRHLTRAASAGVLALPLAMVALPASAAPAECLEADPETGFCLVFAEDPGSGSGGGSGGGGGGNGSGGGGGGGGSGSPVMVVEGQQCLYIGPASPQPPKSFPVWEGNEDGAIHECARGGGGQWGGSLGGAPIILQFWAAEAPEAPPPPNPEDLARDAIASMGLRAIDIGIAPEDSPGSVGVVGMPTWMWADNPGGTTFGPNSASASVAGFTVTVTAEVDRVVWDMGDGTTVTCETPGTPYSDHFGKKASPTCGHTYTRQGQYEVAATSYWTVQWQGLGETGVIDLDFTTSTSITVGEAQVITQ